MDAQEFALRILETADPSVKLAPPEGPLVDRGGRLRTVPDTPIRSESLRIVAGRDARVPSLKGWGDPAQRVRLIHALANHEFQAVELFAWAFLRFPEAPRAFRAGLLRILQEEQEHTKLYCQRLHSLGATFGDYPVSGHFWNKIRDLKSEVEFLCAMSLTFENANLDHTLTLAHVAEHWKDQDHRALFERIHHDERRHVQFGLGWLPRLTGVSQEEPLSLWTLYMNHLTPSLNPRRCSGREMNVKVREEVGFDPEFIQGMMEARQVKA